MKLFERFFSSEKQEKKTNARQAPALAALSLALMGCTSTQAQMDHYERQINSYTQKLNQLKAEQKRMGDLEDTREASLKSLLANFEQLPGLQANKIDLEDQIEDITNHETVKVLTGNEEDDEDSSDNVIRSDGETFGRAEFIAKARNTLRDEGAPTLMSRVEKATTIRLQDEVRMELTRRGWTLDERGLIAGDSKLPFQGGLAEIDVTRYEGNIMITLTNHDGSVHTAIIPEDFGRRSEKYTTSELDTDSYTLE